MARLDEIFDLQMGKTPPRNNADYWTDGQYDWVSIADLGSYQKYVEDTKERISALAVQESGIKSVPANTVIMSFKLSLGKTAITQEPVYTNEAIMAFIPTEKYAVLPDYFYYLFSAKDWTKGTNRAVMGTTLNKATLGAVSITVPPIDEQHKIAAVLDKVSDLIAKRQQQLDKLDEMIKARFMEIFGDSETNTKNWRVLPMSKICSVGSSKRIYQSEQSSSGVPFWRISDLTSLITTGTVTPELYIPEERYKELKTQGQVPAPGDILITSRGTLGQCYIVKVNDRFYFQDGMISWLSGYMDGVTPLYISYLFTMPGFRKQIDSMQAGSTVAYLSITMIKKLKVMLPDIESQQQFASFVSKTEKTKATISRSLEKLETLKKALMQEYFG